MAGEWNLNSMLGFEKHGYSCAVEMFHWERKPDAKPGAHAAFGVCGNSRTKFVEESPQRHNITHLELS